MPFDLGPRDKEAADEAILATMPGCLGWIFVVLAAFLLFYAVRGQAIWTAAQSPAQHSSPATPSGASPPSAPTPEPNVLGRSLAGIFGFLCLVVGIRELAKRSPGVSARQLQERRAARRRRR
jgi:hypothetical protein